MAKLGPDGPPGSEGPAGETLNEPTFDDELITKAQRDARSIALILTEYLCGEKHYRPPEDLELGLIRRVAEQGGFTYEQFNELLLLLDQDRVSRSFFDFCFRDERVSIDKLYEGVARFRGYAMLCFGNFRFAFRRLSQLDAGALQKELAPYYPKESFIARPDRSLDVDRIPRDQTWFLGYISKARLQSELAYAELLIQTGEDESKREEVIQNLRELYELEYSEAEALLAEHVDLAENSVPTLTKIEEQVKTSETKARANNDIYLTWDFLDIYVATSMRNQWEFEETFDFIQDVFEASEFERRPNPIYSKASLF